MTVTGAWSREKSAFSVLVHGGAGDVHVGEVALQELDLGEVCQIVALAGDEAVDDADAIAATDEGFGNV